MKNGWPIVPLGEVIRHRKQFVEVDDLLTYKRCRVQLHAKGVVLRDQVSGMEIKTKKQQVCRSDEFLVAEIDAKLGGYGIVTPDLDGAIVSSHYFLFGINETRLMRGFLNYFIRTPGFAEQVAAQGSTNYAAIRPSHVLGYRIPLPSIEDQRRIVARIEALVAKIDEARLNASRTRAEAVTVIGAKAAELLNGLCQRLPAKTFGSFDAEVTSGPRNWSQYISEGGLRFYRAQDLTADFTIDAGSKCFIDPPRNGQGAAARLRLDDLLIVITGATVGRCARYIEGLEPGFVSQHVATCRFANGELLPAFALWALRSPAGQAQLLGQTYGQGKPGLNLGNIRGISLPVPPPAEQRRIVAYLDSTGGRGRVRGRGRP